MKDPETPAELQEFLLKSFAEKRPEATTGEIHSIVAQIMKMCPTDNHVKAFMKGFSS